LIYVEESVSSALIILHGRIDKYGFFTMQSGRFHSPQFEMLRDYLYYEIVPKPAKIT
jgi:hypothetical protein